MCKTPERLKQYDIAYMKAAKAISELSYAQKKKVGAIIVSAAGQIISEGFNGMPTGFDNCCEDVMPDGKLVTKVEVLHAETNAITKCAKNLCQTKGATLYVTLSPCIHCAKLIVQAEISRVVYLNAYKDMSGVELLRKCGITVEQIDIPELKLYKFKYDNYYSGGRTYNVIATSQLNAHNSIVDKNRKYIMDDETEFIECIESDIIENKVI